MMRIGPFPIRTLAYYAIAVTAGAVYGGQV